MSKLSCILVMVNCALLSSLSGQTVYHIDPKYPVHDVNSALMVISEEEEVLTIEQVLRDTMLHFSHGDELPRSLDVNQTYWGKLRLNALDTLTDWTMHFQDYFIGGPAWGKSNGKIDVYGYHKGGLIFHKKAGVEYPKQERDIQGKWMLNRISLDDLPINKVITFVIRVEGNSLGYPPSFRLSLRSPAQPYYHEIYQPERTFNIFMFGVSFIIFLYHFLQFLYLRQSVFLWFSVWLFFCTMTMTMSIGHFIGSFHSFRYPIWMIFANGIFVPFWFFGRTFINTKDKYPTIDKLIFYLCIITTIEIFIVALYVIVRDPVILLTSVGLHYPFLLFFNLVGFVIASFLLIKKDAYARYFAVGALIGNFAFFIGMLWAMGIVRPPVDPFAWSMFLQIIIYSFGIAYRRQRLSQKAESERLLAQQAAAEVQRITDLDQIKSKFFANISHEFRTPLSLIAGPIEHAIRSNNGNESADKSIELSQKAYSVIKKNTTRLQNLVDQLLDISKIESGQIQLSLIQGSLVKFVRSTVASYESLAERRNISLNTSFPEECSSAFYDMDKLEKVMSNLLSNAFKYTPDGGTVSVGMDISEQFYSIEISDTGKGIKKNDLNKIFDRFYRVEGSESKGSGIGLALTKELVDLHNGQINVSSTIGSGTVFEIRMPMTASGLPKFISIFTEPPINRQDQEVILDNDSYDLVETNDHLTNKEESTLPVALVVEDNNDLREFVESILSKSYRSISAKDGLQGERMAYEHVPDIVITDVMMPGKDGYELCHSLKSNVKTSHIPIIMLTAKAGHSNKLEGLTVGADVFLTKPFDEGELLVRMRNLLSARQKLWEHFKSLDLSIIPELDLTSAEDKFLQQVIQVIKVNLDNDQLSVEDLAKSVGFSRSQLHRKLKAITNKSANQLIVEIRLNEAHRMLENSVGTISEIAYSVGYSNMSYFTKSFKDQFDILPSKINSHA